MKNRNKKMRLLFKRFLVERHLYKTVVGYTRDYRNPNREYGEFVLSALFVWDSTPEGWNFWNNIQTQWIMYYTKHKCDYEYE